MEYLFGHIPSLDTVRLIMRYAGHTEGNALAKNGDMAYYDNFAIPTAIECGDPKFLEYALNQAPRIPPMGLKFQKMLGLSTVPYTCLDQHMAQAIMLDNEVGLQMMEILMGRGLPMFFSAVDFCIAYAPVEFAAERLEFLLDWGYCCTAYSFHMAFFTRRVRYYSGDCCIRGREYVEADSARAKLFMGRLSLAARALYDTITPYHSLIKMRLLLRYGCKYNQAEYERALQLIPALAKV